MINVACPSCGERGAISAEQVGARIKCRKCGQAFRVNAPASKAAGAAVQATPPSAGAAVQAAPPSTTLEGIVVDGLDDAWTTAPPPAEAEPPARAVPTTTPAAAEPPPTPAPRPVAPPRGGPFREYKLLSSRDRIFEGKFELPRMEEIINQMALEGWVAKTMCLPHTKNFQGVVQEEVVVLLERESPGPSTS